MCWLCDSVAPVCVHARAPDLDSYFMCGLCDPNLEKSRTNLDTQTLEEPLLSARAENNHARAENKRGGGALLN